MKKHQIIISEKRNPKGSYTITIDNVRFQEKFPENTKQIMKEFIDDSELFLGFYRIDGIHLTSPKEKELKKEIPAFFQKYGEIKNQNEYLTIAKTKENDRIYHLLPSIFDYYLDTILFNPKISWELFEEFHINYLAHSLDDYIFNNIADILFLYFDSGDFSICFNPEKYEHKEIRTIVDRIFLSH